MNKRIFHPLFFLTVLTLLVSSLAAGETILIRNGAIVTVTGPVIRQGSLLIRDGKIAGIGTDLQTPEGAKVIDATGKYVYPGMVAPLTAIGLTGYPGAGSDTNEVGLSVPYLDPYDGLNPEDETIEVARIDGITSALTAEGAASPINGGALLIHLKGTLASEMVLKRNVLMVFNVMAKQREKYPSTFPGLLQFFREKLNKARDAIENKGESGKGKKNPEIEALIPVVKGEMPVMFITGDEVTLRMALTLMEEYKIKGILFAASADILKFTDEIASKKIPVIWAGTTRLPERWEPVDLYYHTAAVLAERGVLFAFNESRGQGSRNVRRQPVPAAISVAYGLPEEEAVKALTINPARILGVADMLGSLETGKRADIVICSKPLLQLSSKIHTVIIGGEIIPLTSVQTRLNEKYEKIVRERMKKK